MVATEDKPDAKRVGKIEFTIEISDSRDDCRTSCEERSKALTRWLLSQWRLERGEGHNQCRK